MSAPLKAGIAGSPAVPLKPRTAEARIDWSRGRIIGFSVPLVDGTVYDVVHLEVDGRQVASAVANLSVFEFARDLSGFALPSREYSAFEFRIPQGGLLPQQLASASVKLAVHSTTGAVIFEQVLQGLGELLHLTDGVPTDLLFDVEFRGVRSGQVHGIVRSRHGAQVRPVLRVRLNEFEAEPLPLYETSADGQVHHFQVPLRMERLSGGSNLLQVIDAVGQPLGAFPIQLGHTEAVDMDRRVQALEAQVEFLKHLVLTQNTEALPARLAQLKSEVVGVCSEMLTLQRTCFEQETRAAVSMALAETVADAVASGVVSGRSI
ncbi:hypothetical protein [Ideonella sp.]|uniref:hypothetical protein n=1 Tax=Ideonella sp. TaxID=1929293 RepID=UPI003BB808EE